ncbi:unnamed protein product [Closterium sp. NIES-54]
MALRPSSVPLRVPLPPPLESSLPIVTYPSFESTAASALVAELSESASPSSVGGECALGTDVLEDTQEDLECLAAAVPRFASMLLAPEGDPDAPDIPTPRSYAGAITVPREWHDTLRTKLAALGFTPSTADPSLFLCTDTSLPPFYVLVYGDDLVFATAETEALTLVKSELQKRHTCTDLGELRSYIGLQITWDRARCTITLTQSHMVHQVLQRFGFQFSSPQSTPLSTGHSLAAPPSDESVEPSGPYPKLVGCLITSGMGLVLGGQGPVVLTGHADASWVDYSATQRLSQGYTFSPGPARRFLCAADGTSPSGAAATATTATATAAAAAATTTTDTAATAAPACCATMASLRFLAFDHEGRPIQFDAWLDVLQLYLLSDSKDHVSLFDLASGAATAPPATSDIATRSQWLTRDAAAHLAIRNYLPLATHLPDSLHFLSLDPTSLTVDLLEQHLLAAENSAVAVGAACGTPRPPFSEGCSSSPLAPSYASAAAADVSGAEDVGAASASAKRRSSKGNGGRGGGGGSGSGGGDSNGGSGRSGGGGSGGSGGGSGGVGRGGGGSSGSAGSGGGGTGGGSGGSGARRRGSGGGQQQQQQRLSETQSPQHLREWLFQRETFGGSDSCPYVIHTGDRAGQTCRRFHTQTLGVLDSTTLTPLSALVPIRLADPSGGPDVARSSTILPCPAVPSGSLSSLHLPSFSTNFVSTAALQDSMVTTTTPEGQRVSICTCTRPGHHLTTFTRWPGSSLYTLDTKPPQVAAYAQVPPSGQVAPPCSCRLLLHQTLLWHHRLGHPSLPRLHVMHSCLLVSGLPSKGKVPDVLIPWIRAVRLQLRERFGQDLPVMRLHSDRGGEFSFNLLREFFHGEGITQSFTLPASPQQNGIAERRIGLVMEVSRTSMIHVATPHFIWLFEVRYTAHQLNHWPRVSLPETSPTLRLMGEVGDASVFRNVTFDESVPFYRLFPYCSAPLPPPPIFLAPGPPPVDPLPPHGPAPLGVSQVDPLPGIVPVKVAGDSGAARGAPSGGVEPGVAGPGGAESEGAGSGGAKRGGAEPADAEPGGAEPAGVEPGGAEYEGAESGGAEPAGVDPGGAESGGTKPRGATSSGGPAVTLPEPLSPLQLREWLVQCSRLQSGAAGAGDTGAGGTRVTFGAGGTGGTTAACPGGARTRGPGSAGTGGVGGAGAGAGDPAEPGCAGAGAIGPGAGGGGTSTGGAGVGAGDPRAGGAVSGASPVPIPSPYTEQTGGLTERRAPASRPSSPDRPACCASCPRPPPVPGTHAMALRPSSVPLCVPLPPPPKSSLPTVPDPSSDIVRAASPSVSRLLATVVTDPSFESAAASALVVELVAFAAACHLDYATVLVAESESASPPSVGGECALGTDVLEDRQEDFECLAAAVPHFASMLLAPEGDPNAPNIPTLHSYAEAITGPYSSQWQTAMDAEMAS